MSGQFLRLRLIATSDLHAHLTAFDYLTDTADPGLGLEAAAEAIRAARSEVANSLLVDNGDLLQGAPLGDAVAAGLLPRAPHPMIAALADLGCDAATLGNHDFDFGLDLLGEAVRAAPFPFVASNIRRRDGGLSCPQTLVLERDFADEAGLRHRLRIGLLGFVPPQVAQWNRLVLAGRVEVEDILDCARRLAPSLRERCDLVIGLAHSGLDRRSYRPGAENAGRALAASGLFDALVLGHQHLLFPGRDFADLADADGDDGTIAGVPAVMPGYAGRQVGIVDWVLERVDGRWRPARVKASLRSGQCPAPTASPDRARVHERTLAHVARPVGSLATAVTSHFGLVRDCGAVQIVNDAQRWYLRPLLAELGLGDLPLLSAAAPFRCGGRGGPQAYTEVYAGDVTARDIAAIYPFPNALCVVKVDGGGLREWLERAACLFRRIDPRTTEPQMLHDPAFPSFDFDVIDGITYVIDPSRPSRYDLAGALVDPANGRILDLRFEGRPMEPTETFLVATNSYRAFGGGTFPGLDGNTIVHVAAEPCRDVLARYIAAHPGLRVTVDDHWRLAPWAETADLRFLSSPNATLPPDMERTGTSQTGFGEFRIRA